MDISTLMAAIGLIKEMPDSSVAKAEAAAQRSETAATKAEAAEKRAEQYGYRITVNKSTLVVGEEG